MQLDELTQLTQELQRKYGIENVFTVEDINHDYTIVEHQYGQAVLTRNSDQTRCTMRYSHQPRIYYNPQEQDTDD